MTPSELLTGRKPDFSHLKVFGSAAIMQIDASKRTKLNEKGVFVRIIGFTNTGFTLTKTKTGKVYRFAHVKGVNEIFCKSSPHCVRRPVEYL